ncbi:MAG: hypothetical protein ACKPEQ_03265, partial [Dolichospermum sp.]
KTPHDKKQPGRFMYRSCSRILLEVIDVHSEQLQDISDEDAIAEGIEVASYKNYVTEFKNLWESIYGIDSWLNNPLVWVIQFERLETN